MRTEIHFINVGQGNMVLIKTANEEYWLCDCNITEDNEDSVMGYLASVMGYAHIAAFICTHRDADHMRGVQKIHNTFPIHCILDSGYPGTTTTSNEYLEYMRLRQKVGCEVKKNTCNNLGMTRIHYLSAQDMRLERNANAQGLVIKVEHRCSGVCRSSAILTGDCDVGTWRDGIMKDYSSSEIKADILMGAHHGSINFFKDSTNSNHYYTEHMQAIRPDVSIISVGKNPHGHPDNEALKLYERYSKGSQPGKKVHTTQDEGTMRFDLEDSGWSPNPV